MPVRREKTFTGCWTCRERRLKCDEVQPTCGKCASKGLICAGYTARLHWLEPLSVVTSKSLNQRASETGIQRRRLLEANHITNFSDEQIDRFLTVTEHDNFHGRDCIQGPFTVFHVEPLQDSNSTSAHIHVADQDPCLGTNSPTTESPEWSTPILPEPDVSPRSREIETSQDVLLTDVRSTTAGRNPWVQESASNNENQPHSIIATPSYDTYTTPEISSSQYLSDQPRFLTARVKYLLNNYRDHVLPFFSVLHNMRTPWRVLHFPKVLQAACETEISGPPEGPSNILLYAILTTSAYNLQHSARKQRRHEAAEEWEAIATNYNGQALNLLQLHIGSQSYNIKEHEYDELLAAMLSMVTIDVMCGDTRTCEIHLQACEALVRSHVESKGSSITMMSKALHTTFIYLRVMQQVACANHGDFSLELSSYESPGNTLSDVRSLLDNGDFVQVLGSADLPQSSFDSFSSEMIYGIPLQLILLLRSTIRLAEHTRRVQSPGLSSAATDDLYSVRDELEDLILDWPIEKTVTRYRDISQTPENIGILEHNTRAFHLALIIYFFDQLHYTRQRLLQQYVVSVIEHIEQIEKIKTQHGILASPLLWPAFVAASQALDKTIRDRFISWFQASDCVGIGTSKATIDLLQQIWAKPHIPNREGAAGTISQLRLVLT